MISQDEFAERRAKVIENLGENIYIHLSNFEHTKRCSLFVQTGFILSLPKRIPRTGFFNGTRPERHREIHPLCSP
jgi:hypothetical protein